MLSPSHFVLLALLILLALVVFGPKRLPELGASVGRAIQEFRKASSQAATEMRSAVDIGHHDPPPPPPSAVSAVPMAPAASAAVSGPDAAGPAGGGGEAPSP